MWGCDPFLKFFFGGFDFRFCFGKLESLKRGSGVLKSYAHVFLKFDDGMIFAGWKGPESD